jgi:hypothetical protein
MNNGEFIDSWYNEWNIVKWFQRFTKVHSFNKNRIVLTTTRSFPQQLHKCLQDSHNAHLLMNLSKGLVFYLEYHE